MLCLCFGFGFDAGATVLLGGNTIYTMALFVPLALVVLATCRDDANVVATRHDGRDNSSLTSTVGERQEDEKKRRLSVAFSAVCRAPQLPATAVSLVSKRERSFCCVNSCCGLC